LLIDDEASDELTALNDALLRKPKPVHVAFVNPSAKPLVQKGNNRPCRRMTKKPDADILSGFLALDKKIIQTIIPQYVCNTDLPIFIGYDWEFITDRRTFPFVHAIGTVTLTITHSRHRNHLLATILSRKVKMFQCFKIVQFRVYEDIYPESRQRK
jgi:hypothetical protein